MSFLHIYVYVCILMHCSVLIRTIIIITMCGVTQLFGTVAESIPKAFASIFICYFWLRLLKMPFLNVLGVVLASCLNREVLNKKMITLRVNNLLLPPKQHLFAAVLTAATDREQKL